jgi:5-formyltetrahydrofolate cyclo-ligase
MKISGEDKPALRTKIKKILSRIPAEEKKKADEDIFKKILSRPEIMQSVNICVYVSSADEVDTKRIIEHLLIIGKSVIVPKVCDDRLALYKIRGFDELEAGSFGILEPKEGCPAVDTQQVHLFIVPGVAFDNKGRRLGRGLGYYDKLLTGVTAPRIGLAYPDQIVAEVPYSPYDIPMTAVVT